MDIKSSKKWTKHLHLTGIIENQPPRSISISTRADHSNLDLYSDIRKWNLNELIACAKAILISLQQQRWV